LNGLPGLDGPLGLLVLGLLIAALPVAFMALTAFVKIATVLQIVKSALGVQGVPSSTLVLALSAALTLIAMAPVGERILTRLEPLALGKDRDAISRISDAIVAVREPLRGFLEQNAAPREKARFLALASRHRAADAAPSSTDLIVLVPAFLVTELYEAFALGFAIYLPFLVLDLVIANVLLALGMQSINPTQVSLPFKLLLFVATDGWGLLAQSLLSGYGA
jgi:type III secretion protein R